MDRLTSSQLIQINATIIAGLLIILTVSSLNSSEIISKIYKLSDQIESLKMDDIKYQSGITYLQNQISTTNDTDRKNHLQVQIDDLKIQQIQERATLNQSEQTLAPADKINLLGLASQFIIIKKIMAIIMFLPFILSMIAEIFSENSHKYTHTEKPTRLGKVSFLTGLFIFVIGLYYIFSTSTGFV